MPVTFQVVGSLADFGNDARAGVKVRATASPGIKVGDEAVHSNQPETVVTDADGAFTLDLVSLPGVWYRIQTPYGGALPTINLAGYVPDVDDPTTGTAFPPGTVIDVKDVADENPAPGYEAVVFGGNATWAALPDKPTLADVATSGAYADLTGKPTLGTAAATDATDYAGSAFFKRRPAAGVVTTGDVILLGSSAYAPTDTGTSLVAGGAPLYENVVGGNIANVDTDTSNLTGAPTLTGQNGNWNFILSGYDNVVNGWACVVNGFHNTVGAGLTSHVTIGGGSHVDVAEGAEYSSVLGGTRHSVTGSNATIGGGRDHIAAASATVAGGSVNQATGSNATIGGGFTNVSSSSYATVAGGDRNTASSTAATVGGGRQNVASGFGSTVAGGVENTATSNYSTSFGYRAAATRIAEVAFANGYFTAAGDSQVSQFIARAQTTNATPTRTLLNVTSGQIIIPSNTVWAFTVTVAGRRVGGTEANVYKFTGALKRDVSGSTTALIGTVTTLFTAEQTAAWDAVITADTSNAALAITVTGEASKTINWVSHIELVQVTA